MRAFAALLVATCHRRATHAVGGVSPDFPTGAGQGTLPRTEDLGPEPGLDRVRAEKRREAGDGFDGTLVAHPATVALARAEFDRVLGDRPNQLAVQRDDVYITPGDLLAVGSTIGAITERGVRGAVEVVEAFLAAQLRGEGTVAVDGVVIDRAAAELHRVQLWQWVHQQVELDNGLTLTAEVAHRLIAEQLETMRNRTGTGEWPRLGYAEAGSLLLKLTFASELVEHLAEVLPGSDDQPRIAVTTPNTHEGAPA